VQPVASGPKVARELKICGPRKGPDFKECGPRAKNLDQQSLTHAAVTRDPIWLCVTSSDLVMYSKSRLIPDLCQNRIKPVVRMISNVFLYKNRRQYRIKSALFTSRNPDFCL